MPTCPGCGVPIAYSDLRNHVGTCRFIWSEAPRQTDRLSQHLADKLGRVEEHLSTVDAGQSEPQPATDERTDEDRTRNRLR